MAPPMQWFIDIIVERVKTEIGIPPVFINRGDPPAADFPIVTFQRDDIWHDRDLSGIVPAGATAVLIHVGCMATQLGNHLYWRTKGNVNEENVAITNTVLAGLTNYQDKTVPLPASRIIQYRCTAGNWMNITMTVKGWWL